MNTVPISRFRRDCADLLEAARQTGSPLVVTRRGQPVAQVMPWTPTVIEGGRLKDQIEFAGSDQPPQEGSWSGPR